MLGKVKVKEIFVCKRILMHEASPFLKIIL